MPVLDIVVPQMGEGLREVRIVSLSKRPGEHIGRDETIYTMETDKALLEVESAYDGVLLQWLVAEDDVLEIGTPVARIETAPISRSDAATAQVASPIGAQHGATPPVATASGTQATPATISAVIIPPRTRAYCKSLGIDNAVMRTIPAKSAKLMPGDIDAYLADHPTPPAPPSAAQIPPLQPATDTNGSVEKPLSKQQRLFIYRVRRSAQMVVPVTMGRPVAWENIARLSAQSGAHDAQNHISEFQAFAFFAVRGAAKFSKFRSVLLSDERLCEYPHINLGVAVAQPTGDLVTAYVHSADSLAFSDFTSTLRARIDAARNGDDQAQPDMQLVLTYLGRHGVIDGSPLLVAPAVATLFIGATYPADGAQAVNLALTFDHRLINGVEAADFMAELARQVGEADSSQ